MTDTNLKKNFSVLLYVTISGLNALMLWCSVMFGRSSASIVDSKTTRTFITSSFYCLTQLGKGIQMRKYFSVWPRSWSTGGQIFDWWGSFQLIWIELFFWLKFELWWNLIEIIFLPRQIIFLIWRAPQTETS